MADINVQNQITSHQTNKNITLKSLKIVAINVNSIITNQRRYNLLKLLNKENPDLALISETKLNKIHKVQFKNYNIVRRDRPNSTQGGGTAILIKKHLKYKAVTNNIVSNFEVLETTIIKLRLNHSNNLFIVSAYASCNNKCKFYSEFNNLFRMLQLEKSENYYLIAGDLNAKHTDWKNETNNPRGTFLKKWIDTHSMSFKTKFYSSEQPSFPSCNSYLDVCLADARISILNSHPNNTLESTGYDSDHNALIIQINTSTTDLLILESEQEIQKLNYRKADWLKFQTNLNKNCNLEIYNNVNLTNEQIDLFIDQLDKNIQTAIEDAVPKIPSRNSCETYINEKIIKIQKDKSYILSQINKIRRNFTYEKRELLEYYKYVLFNIKKHLKQEFSNAINKYWRNKLKNIPQNDPTNMFPQVNQIFRTKNSVSIPSLKISEEKVNLLEEAGINIPDIHKDNAGNFIITETVEKLNVIGTHFSKIHKQNEHMGRENLNRIIRAETNQFKQEIETDQLLNKRVSSFSNDNFSDNPKQPDININYFTNFNQLSRIFTSLNNKKSASFDGIPNIALKHLPDKVKWYYTVIFNNALNNSYFPIKWKKAKLIAIPKKDKDSSSPSNLRPISLLPNISKVYEVVINNPLVSFCLKNNIIPENQFGFKHKHSTLHAINKLTSDICWALNSKQRVAACLIDLEKAFDTVWLDGLLFKLIKKRFPKYLIKIIWDMVTNKSFIMSDGVYTSSKEFIIENGLQQGTVNSPIIFNIYNSDVINLFNLNSSNHKRSIAFADDLIIYVTGNKTNKIKSELQELFEKIVNYYYTWKLKININKCETILFRRNLCELSSIERKRCQNFFIREKENYGEIIPHKKCVRYLGIHLDEKLYFQQHIETQLTKAKNGFWKVKRLFLSKHLNSRVKILCYQALIRPIITYGCPIWYNISASLMEKIRVFERKCIRACLGTYRSASSNYRNFVSNKKIYDSSKIHRIDCHILKLTRNHFAHASKVKENSLIFGILYPNPMYYLHTLKTGFIPPEAFTYLDVNNFLQDRNNIPIIYHVNRKISNKKIIYESNLNGKEQNVIWRFSMALPQRDVTDKHRKNIKKYWWLQ